MRTEDIKVRLIISIPVDRPDKNGVVYTKKAVSDALHNLQTGLPIIYRDNIDPSGQIIGATTGKQHIVTWDSSNRVYRVTIDGSIFYGGADIEVNDIKDGVVTDFRIASIGLTT